VVSQAEGRPQVESDRKEGAEKIFGLKREVVTGKWRGLHNDKLHDLYSSLRTVG